MLTVEALDVLVYTFLAALWALATLAVIVGFIRLNRRTASSFALPPGRHRAAEPPLLTRLTAALLHGWREMAHAHALITGGAL